MKRGRPFEPGNKFGRGRPRGSRNRRALLAQKLLEDHSPALMSMALMTARGDPQMSRMLVRSLLPHRRHTPAKLGKLALGTCADLDRTTPAVLKKAAAGDISWGEASEVSTVIENRRRVLESRELEQRVSNLEKAGGLVPKAQSNLKEVEIWPMDRLVPYSRNPRKNDRAVGRMCDSIREFGFEIPCLVRSDGDLVDGHLRLKAARQLGMTDVPVILCDEWTEAQVKAFRLLVNRSATWAGWDEELLARELQELQQLDFKVELTGFDTAEIDRLLTLPTDEQAANAAPPPPETPVSRLGDLWLLGEHRLLCGNATSPEVVKRLLAGRQPILMVTIHPMGLNWIRNGGTGRV